MRTMFYEFPEDAACWDISDAYMFGSDILVAPIVRAKATSRTVYLPAGASWTLANTGDVYEGGKAYEIEAPIETLPIFLRDGNRDIWWERSDKSQSSCLVMGRQQMRIADSCMKKKRKREKHSGRSTRSKGMLFRCYKSIPDPKTDFSLAPHTGGQKNLRKRMTCRQIQLIPFFPRQRNIACRDNLFQAFFTCRTGDELHIRRMAQNPRRCNRGITDTVFSASTRIFWFSSGYSSLPRKHPFHDGIWNGDHA